MVKRVINCFYDYITYMSDADNSFKLLTFSEGFTPELFLKEATSHREESAEKAFLYGECYYQGIGTKPKADIALEWFIKAAKERYPLALQHLAFLLFKLKKPKEGFDAQLRAASTGNPSFEYQCGMCYEEGRGTDKDIDRAVFWYMNSAQKGYALAELEMGIRHIRGDHVEKNNELGLKYLYSAADKGNFDAKREIMKYFNGPAYITDVEDFLKAYNCKIPPKYMTFSGFFDEKELYQTCNRGYRRIPSYGFVLYICIENRIGMRPGQIRDPLKPLVVSASLGYKPSIKLVMKKVNKGEKLPMTDEQLIAILTNGVKLGVSGSYVALAECYKTGRGVEKNKEEQLRILRLGALNGDKRTRTALADFYKEEGNLELAEYWYKRVEK